MNTHAFEKKLHSLKARFGLQLFVLAAVVCTSWIVTDHANAVYILTGPEDAAIVLNEEEVREGEMSSQLVYLSSGQSGYDMSLTAGQEVTVTHDGSTVTTKARNETVAELLERLHITPSPLEMVAVDLDEDSAELTIASELTYYDQVEEPATYETVRVANPSLPKGTEKVVQEGADGVRTSIYEVVWSGGEEISRQFVEELESTAVNEVVEYGTAEDIFYRAAHPYTWALMSSMPDLDTNEKLEAIPGTPPNMIYPPVGDAFAARNKYAMQIDFEQQPPMFQISDTHYAATWLLHPDAPKVEMPKIIVDRIRRMKEKNGGAADGE